MSIDEAIEKESKIAKEEQKIVDTQIVFDNVSISELYCDDTEVIEEHLSNYRKCAEYHKQIADWLEELKSYREHIFSGEMTQKMLREEYNKAIDAFAKKFIVLSDDGEFMTRLSEFPATTILELAERLKVVTE